MVHLLIPLSLTHAQYPAVVDTMGCEMLAKDSDPPKSQRWQTLVALMLSSQTKDERTASAMVKLRAAGVLVSPESMEAAAESEVGELIKEVGFWRRKAVYLRKAATILREQHASDVPADLPSLLALPGVGPKMSHLFLQSAYGITQGIGVDVHVHRISERLGWTHDCKTPEHTRKYLEGWLPVERWSEINMLLVGLGQTV